MHPAVYEALIFALMGVSGVGVALLFGIRQAIPLAATALGASVVLRVWSSFTVWSLGLPQLNFELWLGVSVAAIILAVLFHLREWQQASLAIAIFGILALISLGTKYLLDIGERHHSDVSQNLGMAIVLFQGDSTDLEPAAKNFKRGIAYPLMLALGPEGRILGGFTPMVFLTTLLLAGWLCRKLMADSVKTWVIVAVAAVVAVFSVTVPMFRAAMFYLNGHTLMGFAILLLVGGVLLAFKAETFGQLPGALVLLGGVIGVTARIEGVVLVLFVLAFLVSRKWFQTARTRLRLFATLALIGLSLAWWITSLESPVFQRLGIPNGTEWLLILFSLAGALVVSLPVVDSLRRFLVPTVSIVIGLFLAREVWQAGDPLSLILSQFPNLALGAGGWGTAAHLFVASVILLGFKRRSKDYRILLGMAVILIAGILFSKTFDGGFGREGFYDSVNRMWLHVMPTILLTTLVGYSEILHNALRRGTQKKSSSGRKEKLAAAN